MAHTCYTCWDKDKKSIHTRAKKIYLYLVLIHNFLDVDVELGRVRPVVGQYRLHLSLHSVVGGPKGHLVCLPTAVRKGQFELLLNHVGVDVDDAGRLASRQLHLHQHIGDMMRLAHKVLAIQPNHIFQSNIAHACITCNGPPKQKHAWHVESAYRGNRPESAEFHASKLNADASGVIIRLPRNHKKK